MNLTKTSILIACKNPKKLSKFYSLVSNSSVSNGITDIDYELRDNSSFQVSFYKPSSKRDSIRKKPPSIAICFKKQPSSDPESVLADWVKEVISYGGKLFNGPDLEPFGAEAWMLDAEDNKFLIFVPYKVSN